MTERIILADCCEDWILEWGGFYKGDQTFACPECETGWTRTARTFRRATDGREFARRERRGPEASFTYLASADGQEPIVDRCCAKILLTHGARMPEGPFMCPVCATIWDKRWDRLHGLRVAVFAKEGLAEPLAIQPGRTRSFLVTVSGYSPPRD